MLHLIEKALPAPLHRALLPVVARIRDRWRRWRKVELSGCCVVITNSAGEVLMLRHSYGPPVWALPGGGVDKGEDPEAAARREVLEELGMELGAVQSLGVRSEQVSNSPHTAYLFTAICDAEPRPDQREVIEARFFPADVLPEPLGRITSARLEVWRAETGQSHSSES